MQKSSQQYWCVHKIFENQVSNNPNATALIYENALLSYKELNQKANQLAHYLQKLGVSSEVPVGVFLERSLEMVIGILGILKAGGVYTLIDPAYPLERIAFIMEDVQTPIVITQQNLEGKLPVHWAQVVYLDLDWKAIALENEENPSSNLTPENLAYIVYTSGSTGKPKGIEIPHRSIIGFMFEANYLNLNSEQTFLQYSSVSWDAFTLELWTPLLHGARCVLYSGNFFTPKDLGDVIQKYSVDILWLTSALFNAIIDLVPEVLLSVKQLIIGGEALSVPHVHRALELLPSTKITNGYGPSECTVFTCCYHIPKQLDETLQSIPIGKPIGDRRVYLLDSHLNRVPIGILGELYVGGFGVARGYNQPELTAEKFIPNPLIDEPGSRLYRTGDLARYLPDGSIEFIGRIDHQVKIRGFRIELREIEAVLGQHSEVQQVVVLMREDESGNKCLASYIIPNQESSVRVSDLRHFLKEKLPEYMIPSVFILLETLPLTPNGKVDRQALPALDTVRPELEEGFVQPQTRTEKILTEIWIQVLGVEQVGIHDNFFELGGDSIRSIQVLSKAQEKSLNLSVQQIFQYQTIQELARELKSTEATNVNSERTHPFSLISQEDCQRLANNVEDAYPLTMLQEGMLFHNEYSPENAVYHDIFSFHIRTPLNLQSWETATQQLITRHTVLRTAFDLTGYSEPLQLVYQTVDIPLQVDDIRHLAQVEQDKVLAAWIESEKLRRFDWRHPPLIRFQLHRRSEETFQFSLSFHHAILDGWSLANLITEFYEIYISNLHKKTFLIQPPPAITYRDFVALELKAIESGECRDYWLKKLSDSTISKLPRWPSSYRIGNNQQRILVKEVPLIPEVSEGLRQLAQSMSVPLKSVLLAAHLIIMSLLSGQSDVLTGLVTNGRPEATDGERVLGLFLNTIPFRLNLLGGSWIDLVRKTFEAEQELLAFRRYPMAKIQRDLGRQPLFETAFNFTHFHIYQSLQESNSIEVLAENGYAVTNFTFMADFSVDLFSSQVKLTLTGDGLELCNRQMEDISGYYTRTLTAMGLEPLRSYKFQQLISDNEWHQLVVDWNDTISKYPADQCIHQLFEQQVEHTPDAVAAVFQDQQITYQELNCRANQFAHHLQALGVKPEVLVGICVNRSLEMLVGLLAILKAGGAYLPLDPTYPQERLAFMLLDSQIQVLLTQQQLLDKLPIHQAQTFCLDQDWQTISQQFQVNPNSKVHPHNLAYVIYTSGSTGKPKGTMIIHSGMVNYLSWCIKTYNVADGEGATVNSSIGFDATITSLFSPLLVGQKVVLLPEVEEIEALKTALCSETKFSLVKITPAHLEILNQMLAGNKVKIQTKAFIIGGETLSAKCISFWEQYAPEIRLINEYGPTETVVGCCIYEVGEQDFGENNVPIGRAIANTELYILNNHLQPVPIGVIGELYIGGAGVSRGYLNCPDLTAKRFISHPFSERPGSRLYKTGDLARYLPDGNIEYMGRIDNQVKIRGFRIELEEIEAVLAQHSHVAQTTVITREDHRGDKILVAYIVPQQEGMVSSSELYQFLKEILPNYMIPSVYVQLDTLPLNTNGKVNRSVLPKADISNIIVTNEFVLPRNELELHLTQIWQNILNINTVGVKDNFFEMGGHSLLAVRLMAQIQQQFAANLPLATLLQNPTIEQIAEILRQKTNSLPWSPLVPIQKKGSKLPFFCVSGIDGNVIYFRHLAQHLGLDQPFYTLQALGLDDISSPFTRVEDIAAHYIQAIQTVQPQGPYIIGGYSFGSWIAFEMSQQLQKQANEVALLVILDGLAPIASNKPQNFHLDEATRLKYIIHAVERLSGKKLDIPYEVFLTLNSEEQFNYLEAQLTVIQQLAPATITNQLRGLLQVFDANVQAGIDYLPQDIYPSKIALYFSSESNEQNIDIPLDPMHGWGELACELVDIQVVPGDHYTMIAAPHVQVLAEKLRQSLNQVQSYKV
ncbi:amino acid adenylation domain-containing protein [Nostoc sp. CCY 9925]|uniref:amino acid adenylation domain-containing protein n=1 Tax=Nostoc sp. CCY 9925 TaxID=3103865 RepID=UPI0039C6278C